MAIIGSLIVFKYKICVHCGFYHRRAM